MFATGQSVYPEPGRGRTAFCRPVRSFLEPAPHIRVKDRPHHPRPSPAVFHRLPLFSVVFRCFLPSPTVPYQNVSQIVGLVALPNDGRPGNSRTRTDYVLPSRLFPGSWQSPRRALRGPRTAANIAFSFLLTHMRSPYLIDRIPDNLANIRASDPTLGIQQLISLAC